MFSIIVNAYWFLASLHGWSKQIYANKYVQFDITADHTKNTAENKHTAENKQHIIISIEQ